MRNDERSIKSLEIFFCLLVIFIIGFMAGVTVLDLYGRYLCDFTGGGDWYDVNRGRPE